MTTFKYKGSIEKKLLKIILSIVTLTFMIGYIIFVAWFMSNQEQKNIALAKTVSHVLSQNFAKLILMQNVAVAADITSQLNSFDAITSIVLYNKNKQPIYQYAKNNKNFKALPLPQKMHTLKKDDILTLFLPVTYMQTQLGYVRFNIRITTFKKLFIQDLPAIGFIYLLMLLLSYILAKFYAAGFTKPVLNLVNFLEKIDFRHTMQNPIEITEYNEFGKLYAEVNAMLERINNSLREEKIASAAFNIQSGMIITDAQMRVIQVNHAFETLLGYSLQEIIGKLPPVLLYNNDNKEFIQKINKELDKVGQWSGEIQNRKKDNTVFWENLTIQQVLDEQGKRTHYVFSFSDLTLQKAAEEKLQYLMQYDPITGLANKELFLKSLQKRMDHEAAQNWHAVFNFDIKDFKLINDVYGYELGDLLLQSLAERIKKEFKESDFIAKIGIDEFILCYRNMSDSEDKALELSNTIGEYLLTLISQPFTIQNKELHVSIRIGITLYDDSMKDASAVLKQANVALQLAKQRDIGYAFFNKELEKQVANRVDMYSELLVAIKKEQFQLYYQLQFDKDQKPCGAEALIRWVHPTKGVIPPNEFIPLAEKTGLIIEIGTWVLNTGCQELAKWAKKSKTSHLSLAINVSAKQFAQDDFIQKVEEAVSKNSISYKNLKIELVESMLVEDLESVVAKMKQLRELGAQISMDDFGTGYSSLSYLKNLPLTQIKIDQSFIMHMIENPKDKAIVKSMIELGDAFGFNVIAEGVETKEDFILLQELGCYYYQGYYFAKPQESSKLNF